MLEKLKQELIRSLADCKLDKDERDHFVELLQSLTDDQKRYLRNQAFDLARDKIADAGADSRYKIKTMAWLERIVKLVDNSNNHPRVNTEAYFSPGDECRDGIVNLLASAHHRIDICVFTISDDRISKSILDAHNNDIAVRILTDNDKANDRGSDIYRLQERGIPVVMDTSPSHMHHKFALIDDALINGSFNWTRSASDRNQENIVISDSPVLIDKFDRVFKRLWDAFS